MSVASKLNYFSKCLPTIFGFGVKPPQLTLFGMASTPLFKRLNIKKKNNICQNTKIKLQHVAGMMI